MKKILVAAMALSAVSSAALAEQGNPPLAPSFTEARCETLDGKYEASVTLTPQTGVRHGRVFGPFGSSQPVAVKRTNERGASGGRKTPRVYKGRGFSLSISISDLPIAPGGLDHEGRLSADLGRAGRISERVNCAINTIN